MRRGGRGGGGGTPIHFFSSDNFRTSFTLLGRGTLGTQHRPPGVGWQAKKKKKKKKQLKFRGGGDTSPPSPPLPPPMHACMHTYTRAYIQFTHMCTYKLTYINFMYPFFSPDNFRTSFTLLGRGTLGTQHRPPGWGDKQKKNNNNNWNLGGGGHVPPVPPASAAYACMHAYIHTCIHTVHTHVYIQTYIH